MHFLVTLAMLFTEAQPVDLILHSGHIITVNDADQVAEAMAVAGERILAVGTNAEVRKLASEATRQIDLAGKTVIPGLIDSHVHASEAAMHGFDHELPVMESVPDVLDYIRARAAVSKEGEWISLSQVFITRLREQRFPTRAELDAAAPKHPVVFATGPDAMLNSLALRESGIDKNFQVAGSGEVEKDPVTGEPTGMLRACQRYIKSKSSGQPATEQQRLDRLSLLLADYNAHGITGIIDRAVDDGELARFAKLREGGRLTTRVAASWHLGTGDKVEDIQAKIRELGRHKLRAESNTLRLIGIKTFLDGGMLTGSAYMREPWGVSDIYGIRDPKYRGVLFIEREKLLPIVQTCVEEKLQFTAHSVGDGAVHLLLDVYAELSKTHDVKSTRPCLTHCNFMSREAVEQMQKIGAVADIQPAWLYLDAHTLAAHFGEERLAWFQPLRPLFEAGVIVGGGSDHMQRIDALRATNPYDPFLGMWVALTRQSKHRTQPLHTQHALDRRQALRFYTRNNAWLMFLEKDVGTLEAGKLADFVIVDRNLLTCPVDDVRTTQVLATYLGGKAVFERK